MMKPRADGGPACGWEDGWRRCGAPAAWELRCAPRRADSRRGSWPGDVDVLRVCSHHLQLATGERRVLGPPAPLEEPG
jgi:hypothetical protein